MRPSPFAMPAPSQSSEDNKAEPRTDDEAIEERQEHGRRRTDGDGSHVRAHESRDKGMGRRAAITAKVARMVGVAHLVDRAHGHGGKHSLS